MTLDQQIQSLIDGAPDVESRISVMAIAPILQQVAATLPHLEYYICQSPQGERVITTLRHRQQPVRAAGMPGPRNVSEERQGHERMA